MLRGFLAAGAVAAALVSACASPNPAYRLVEDSSSDSGPSDSNGGGDSQIVDDGHDDDDPSDSTDSGDDVVDPDTGTTSFDPPETSSTTAAPGDSTSSGGISFPMPHACCTPTPMTPGCEDGEVEACTCAIDEYCCVTGWDQLCANTAVDDCGVFCFDPTPCCHAGKGLGCADAEIAECVCEQQPSCCTRAWTSECALLVETCSGMECPVGSTSCCAAQGNASGCDDFEIQACVCGTDPFCCVDSWDPICVSEVGTLCGGDCGPTGTADCCTPDGTAGCVDQAGGPGVQNCVCDNVPSCCDTMWDDGCVQIAMDTCGLSCP